MSNELGPEDPTMRICPWCMRQNPEDRDICSECGRHKDDLPSNLTAPPPLNDSVRIIGGAAWMGTIRDDGSIEIVRYL